ncbi:MAG: hypothetical protein GY754_15290 [bacterium]|nr:hypothetical protein [bacterium]
MKKLLTIFIAIIAIYTTACGSGFEDDAPATPEADPWEGTVQIGADGDDKANSTVVDSEGNIYVSGFTSSDLDGYTNAGSYDIFIIKYKSSGEKVWTRVMGTTERDQVNKMAMGSDDTIYITGFTTGDLDGNTNTGGYDAFIAAYNTEGDNLWTKLLGTDKDDEAFGVAVDKNNGIYITGWTKGLLDGVSNNDREDLFLAKYNSQGGLLWVKQRGTDSYDLAYDVAIGTEGNVYITGHTHDDLDDIPNTQAGNYDIFLIMYSPEGTYFNTKLFGSTENDYATSIAIDSANNVYITGRAHGDMDGAGSGTYVLNADLYLVKLNSNRETEWIRQYGSEQGEEIHGIAIDSADNIYITGCTNNSLGLLYDITLLKFDSSGTIKLSRQFGALENDYARDIFIDSSDNIFLTGYTEGGIDTFDNAGSSDGFLMKIYSK